MKCVDKSETKVDSSYFKAVTTADTNLCKVGLFGVSPAFSFIFIRRFIANGTVRKLVVVYHLDVIEKVEPEFFRRTERFSVLISEY